MKQLKIKKQFTERSASSISTYLLEISKYDVLTPEEEVELVQKSKTGSEKALTKLIQSNLKFVVSVAKQYQGKGMDLVDLINEGNIGLIKATKKFDETKGFKFISYAVWWIRQSILQALTEDARVVRLPQNKINDITKFNSTFSILEQKYNREPSISELADSLGVENEDVSEAVQITKHHISLDDTISSDDDMPSLIDRYENEDSIIPDVSLIKESLKDDIKRAFLFLKPKERDVLTFLLGLDGNDALPICVVAEKMGYTSERIRQIKKRAIEKLQKDDFKILSKYL